MSDEEWDIRTNTAWPHSRQKTFMRELGESEGYGTPGDWIGYRKQNVNRDEMNSRGLSSKMQAISLLKFGSMNGRQQEGIQTMSTKY